jgi:D-sedoheptulose 7-phosphate isomerase
MLEIVKSTATPVVPMQIVIDDYADKLARALKLEAMQGVAKLAEALRTAWIEQRVVYLCGNGRSAGNAIHLANDFLFGAGCTAGRGLRVESLAANPAVLTCLANDIGYDRVFAEQLRVKADAGDVLIALSGSGNSPNIVKALEMGNALGMKTFAILGYSGGRCRDIARYPIHFAIDDMQVAEDLQLIVGHMCMQWLKANPIGFAAA